MRLVIALVLSVGVYGQILPFPGGGAGVGTAIPAFTSNQITCTSSFSNTLSCTLPSTPTNGNCLVLGMGTRVNVLPAAVINSVTESNVTWVSAGSGTNAGTSLVTVWIGKVDASASASLTISFGGGNNAVGVANIREAINIPNCDATSIDTAFVANAATSNAPTTGAYTTSHAIDLVYVLSKLISTTCSGYNGQPSGYSTLTCIQGGGASDATQPNYIVVGSAGAQSATWGLVSSQSWLTGIVALKGN